MADTKITQLQPPQLGYPVVPATDVLPIVVIADPGMATSGSTRKVTVNQILGSGGTATLASATISGDLTVRTNVLKVISTGVGIGTATPNAAYILDLTTANDARARQWVADTGFLGSGNLANGYQLRTLSGSTDGLKISNYANSVEYLRIDSSGNVGVGVVPSAWGAGTSVIDLNAGGSAGALSSSGTLSIANNAFFNGTNWTYKNNAAALLYQLISGTHRWFTAGASTGTITDFATAKMTLDGSGRLLVGKTTSGFTTVGAEIRENGEVIQTIAASTDATFVSKVYSSTAAAYRFYVGLGGTVFATNTTISSISDARLKENVQDLDVGLGAILALKPRKFDWKAGKGKDIKGDRGFIAQEFEQVFPNLIDEWADPAPEGEASYKSVRQDLIPVLVKAIQELAAEVNALKKA
jgi:hypothetical protein